MQYYARFAIGLVLGLIVAAAAWTFSLSGWLSATVAALLAMLGFLGTFFIWSADRLDEGYEQVLFDGRNNVHALVLAVLLAGASFGTSLIGRGEEAAPDPTALALSAHHKTLIGLYNDIQAGTLEEAGVENARATLDEVGAELEKLDASPKLSLLQKARQGLVAALEAYHECGDAPCQAASLALFDAKSPLNKYAAA